MPRSRERVGSHYESAWSSPEAERTWHFIRLPSSDHTSQSDSPAPDDDRREMQPADWPTEAPLRSTERPRDSGEWGKGWGLLQHQRSANPKTLCVWVHDHDYILGRSADSLSVLIFYTVAGEVVLLLILA